MGQNLYCTADEIGIPTGGGIVTIHEAMAMASLGPTCIFGKRELHDGSYNQSPWLMDALAYRKILATQHEAGFNKFDKALFYSGSFPAVVDLIMAQGTKVAYTCAAHNPHVSKEEFEKLGIPYSFPHLTDPVLNNLYMRCFRNANILICPSNHSANVMVGIFGCQSQRIKVIPHGTAYPEKFEDYPERFTIGYLGQVGPDKGLIYSLSAWNLLKLKDATFKINCNYPEVLLNLNAQYGNHPIDCQGRVENTSDFYNKISVYVSASSTEGFGIPVLEAMAHGRPVICTRGTGASDLVEHGVNGFIVECRDVYAIAECINEFNRNPDRIRTMGAAARETAKQYTWDKIIQMYASALRSL